MEQVKFFSEISSENLEQNINDWLKEHPNIEIVSRKLCICPATVADHHHQITFPATSCLVAIFYVDK